jgi:tetratricopeptide (TPR) repeat protein
MPGVLIVPSFSVPPSPDVVATQNQYHSAVAQGEAMLQAGNPSEALSAFQQAHTIEPDDGEALVGMARAYTDQGQTDKALTAYRALFYHAPGRRWSSSDEADPTTLMRFALLLNQTGQGQEALTAYHRALAFVNYDGGKPNLEVPVPEIDTSAQPYTPQLLAAMAHLAIGINTPGFDPTELQEAVRLTPDSAAANYYWGKYLYTHNKPGAKAYLQKTVQLGDDQTGAAAKQILQFLH